ncbi:MAG: DUF1127 domain-containing protein [Rhodovulum sp.]|nr:DUF1127 domain-containing protein [Paracoccaceae bacterium]MCC0068206.1 DUF1127 domain-containing protein [Rhodovulum sp.]
MKFLLYAIPGLGDRRRRRDETRLREMPDYLLEDIGLSREQINAMKRRRFS